MQEPLSFLQFSSLNDVTGLKHAITTRNGGVSSSPYQSLNLGYHVDDRAESVTHNRTLLANALGYGATSLVCAQQVHGAHSIIVNDTQRGRGALDWHSAIPQTDALITREQQLPLLILVADCAPLLLADPVQHVLAVVHAGWRGAVAGIAAETVRHMQAEFQSHPAGIRVGIGPCLCAPCLEVGPEVAAMANAACPAAIKPALNPDKAQLDLRALLEYDLKNAGVPPEQIEAMPHCPRCRPDIFFSHRGQHGTTGRFGLVAWWD
ncbi:MAG: peptidoglycan editing factor PgeF [Abitibacteriaceae bacterium]|nr:peptidoglycan editing factor PgeF [Abditibacteriaceae bacterium]MBV9865015.1 peptidoglycan editing factor PgeF [Abditibacteriaceae bacterium]